jgi:hypothetical protein
MAQIRSAWPVSTAKAIAYPVNAAFAASNRFQLSQL